MTLLSTAFAPDLAGSKRHHDKLELFGLFSFVQNRLNHSASFVKVVFGVSCDQHIKRLIILLLPVVDLGLVVLRPVASDRYPAPTLFFKFLLRLASRSNNLPDIVHTGVVWLRDLYLALLFRGLVVRRRNISGVQLDNLIDQLESLLDILFFEPYIPRVRPEPRLGIVDWFRRGRSDVRIVLLIVLYLNTGLKFIKAVTSHPDFNFFQRKVLWKVAETRWHEGLFSWSAPASPFITVCGLLPPTYAHVGILVKIRLLLRQQRNGVGCFIRLLTFSLWWCHNYWLSRRCYNQRVSILRH